MFVSRILFSDKSFCHLHSEFSKITNVGVDNSYIIIYNHNKEVNKGGEKYKCLRYVSNASCKLVIKLLSVRIAVFH